MRICLLTFKQKGNVRNLTYRVVYVNQSKMLVYIIRSLNIYKNMDSIFQNSVGKK